jgi:hypothetical protein
MPWRPKHLSAGVLDSLIIYSYFYFLPGSFLPCRDASCHVTRIWPQNALAFCLDLSLWPCARGPTNQWWVPLTSTTPQSRVGLAGAVVGQGTRWRVHRKAAPRILFLPNNSFCMQAAIYHWALRIGIFSWHLLWFIRFWRYRRTVVLVYVWWCWEVGIKEPAKFRSILSCLS